MPSLLTIFQTPWKLGHLHQCCVLLHNALNMWSSCICPRLFKLILLFDLVYCSCFLLCFLLECFTLFLFPRNLVSLFSSNYFSCHSLKLIFFFHPLVWLMATSPFKNKTLNSFSVNSAFSVSFTSFTGELWGCRFSPQSLCSLLCFVHRGWVSLPLLPFPNPLAHQFCLCQLSWWVVFTRNYVSCCCLWSCSFL